MDKPNVFFVVLDAVRPDNLSCYGYPRKTTPNIDKISDEGVLFENAFSTS
ncbi:sulfatase-like hydrolase/transferase, partial [Candidatus Bathyarchaeota archaeon]|nr:sulfatase-like hydrolase/transferase [Candidatus Bathyarchaeota archaeon]